MRYRTRLLLTFSALFAVFTLLLAAVVYERERLHARTVLEARLRVYADLIENRALVDAGRETAMRVTVIDSLGRVAYESTSADAEKMHTHATRPEVVEARRTGEGADIRRSESTGLPYYYFAKRYGDHVVRVALPYNADVRHLLRADPYMLWFLLALFLVCLFALAWLSDHIGKGVTSLRKFMESADRGLVSFAHIQFPKSELGDLGRRIAAKYAEAETARREVVEEQARGRELKRRMTSNITHELRTPVASMRGYLELLHASPDLPEARRREFTEKAYQSALRLSDLIRDVALITKTEQAPDTLPRENVALVALVHDLAEELRPALDEARQSLTCQVPEGVHIYGNYSLLYAIFRNLLENSIRYAGEARLTLAIDVQADGSLVCRYADTGRGVAPEHLPHLFERFYRADAGRNSRDGGTGLGLSIVRNAVAFHGGEIHACLPAEGGLAFTFTLQNALGEL